VIERNLRASEIVEFLYCQRAWWYTQQGNQSEETRQRLTMGNQIHGQHGRAVIRAGCLRALGYIFLAAAFVSSIAYLTSVFLE
jgi:hypothetical protein